MRRRFALPLILFASALALGLGLVLPLVRVERLYFLTDDPSLVAIIAALWRDDEVVLATVVALFSIVFPCLKLAILNVVACAGTDAGRIPLWLRALSNWSMLDVLLVALVLRRQDQRAGNGLHATWPVVLRHIGLAYGHGVDTA